MSNTVEPIRGKKDRERMKEALHGRDRLLFTLGVSIGLRISDLLELKIGDVRGQTSVKVREKKTKKVREIHLNKTMQKELASLTGPDDEYIFKSRQGGNKPISRVQAYRILNDAAKRAGIADKIGPIGTHTLRKTFGYIMYQNGTDITRLMKILSHSSPEITLDYIGITREEIIEAYEAVEV
ncbi:tyrosine-type recombinase/integrase [Fictibacillus sp. Mic-4]|uniref:tyrosine-type recombinase/integrase n=1 Tax=Fictibacillus sp. Mic-4 TaxID=3132826 RepID=UPI003CF117AB